MINPIDKEILEIRARQQGSLLLFSQTYYEIVEGSKFIIPSPTGREPHPITICKMLTKVKNLEVKRWVCNLPPGHFKTTMLCLFVSWVMSMYPDCFWMYIGYSKEIATKATKFIRSVMSCREYQEIFGVKLINERTDHIITASSGEIKAFSAEGSITGFNAGRPGIDRISGGFIYDDAHNFKDVFSETLRQKVMRNYMGSVRKRLRGVNPVGLCIGQRLHEDDLPNHLLSGKDIDHWERTILPAIDESGNALYPEEFPLEKLLKEQEIDPYNHAAQNQQSPAPAGGSVFREEWMAYLDDMPEMLCTFITIDTAETAKNYNDATVFTFMGLYNISGSDEKSVHGLHIIDCLEVRVEPHELESAFMDFYVGCNRFKTPPYLCAFEKKSTGVTLVANMKNKLRGVQVKSIERTVESGSKTFRFMQCQTFFAQRLISFPSFARHTRNTVEHLCKITANDTHAHDDIADTICDGIRMAFIDKSLQYNSAQSQAMEEFNQAYAQRNQLTQNFNRNAYGYRI